MSNGFTKVTLPDFSNIARPDATYIFNSFKIKEAEELLFAQTQRIKQEAALKKIEEEKIKKQHESLKQIIANDPAAPKNLNKDKMADMILEASKETGVDPVIIAGIAKQETHFTQNVQTGNGSGIMQLTTISIKDMYLRPGVYDQTMNKLIKKYGSWEKIAEAKKKDPSLELGNFGEMLYKYGSVDKLKAAVRKDPQLNLKLGAYLFKAKLAQAGGNVKKALENYNGSRLKIAYAKSVMNFIDDAKSPRKFEAVTA